MLASGLPGIPSRYLPSPKLGAAGSGAASPKMLPLKIAASPVQRLG